MKKSFGERMKNMGPAAIITSAFIGPGTITSCTVAGIGFGYALLWALVFSGIALIILMEMSARTTLATGMNLVDSSVAVAPENPVWKWLVRIVFFLTVLVACFAFQAGNEIGAARGLADICGLPIPAAAILIGLLTLATTWIGSYKTLETIMQIFVSLMGVLFLITALVIRPDWGAVLRGLIPTLPEGSYVNAMALIGTTLIGMNLIVHSISCQEKYASAEELGDAKFDIVVNILIGVVISVSILITGATVLYQSDVSVSSPLVFTQALEPVLGSWARIVGDIGLTAAGLSSAVAVSYTIRSIFSRLFRWEGGQHEYARQDSGLCGDYLWHRLCHVQQNSRTDHCGGPGHQRLCTALYRHCAAGGRQQQKTHGREVQPALFQPCGCAGCGRDPVSGPAQYVQRDFRPVPLSEKTAGKECC